MLDSSRASLTLRRCGRGFALDLRSLAACRIALAALLLCDASVRWGEAETFLTDDGLTSREEIRRLAGDRWIWSLHALRGDLSWQRGLLAAQAVAAVALLVGFRTRLATWGCWLLTLSLQTRNPLIINAGDTLLRMLLFWALFLPWGNCWSLDSRRAAAGRPRRLELRTPAATFWALQICLVYWVTGWLKCNELWLGGAALQNTFTLDFCVKPPGRWLGGHASWWLWATPAVPLAEMALPALLWIPWLGARARTPVVLAMLAFHQVIAVTLHVGLFAPICQAAWLSMLPGAFWDWARRRAGEGAAGSGEATGSGEAAGSGEEGKRTRVGKSLAGMLAAAAFAVVLIVNARTLWPGVEGGESLGSAAPPPARRGDAAEAPPLVASLAAWTRPIADFLMLQQHWNMFDRPPQTDTWIVAEGWLATGETLDALRRGAAVRADGSPETARNLPSQHWRYYFRRMAYPEHASWRQPAAEYLLRSWNVRAAQERQIVYLRLLLFRQSPDEDGFEVEILATAGQRPLPPLDFAPLGRARPAATPANFSGHRSAGPPLRGPFGQRCEAFSPWKNWGRAFVFHGPPSGGRGHRDQGHRISDKG